jgi:hypothetical protein
MMPGSSRTLHGGGIPDMRYINREIRIADIARKLDLRLDGSSKIHCWRPDRHQHRDRTASVGIRATNNTAKCFGCGHGPIGPIDLVMDVLGMSSPADAALWIAERFPVPSIPARRPVPSLARAYRVGYERGLGLLVRSGLWVRCRRLHAASHRCSSKWRSGWSPPTKNSRCRSATLA